MTITNEWRDLPTFEDVADAKRTKDEIEIYDQYNDKWLAWSEDLWCSSVTYRARPAQPKMKKVKTLGWWHPTNWDHLIRPENVTESMQNLGYVRYPKLDDEIEVPE